jgi:hypothetical protein
MSTSDVSLPPFFPLVRAGCEKVSSDLFQCLNTHSEPQGSIAAADAAMVTCDEHKAAYARCTRASLDAKGAKKPIVLVDWETG